MLVPRHNKSKMIVGYIPSASTFDLNCAFSMLLRDRSEVLDGVVRGNSTGGSGEDGGIGKGGLETTG